MYSIEWPLILVGRQFIRLWCHCLPLLCRDPSYSKSFIPNSHLIEILYYSKPSYNKVITKNFAHATPAMLSWHVQNFVAIPQPDIEYQWNVLSVEFFMWVYNYYFSEMGPWVKVMVMLPACSRFRTSIDDGRLLVLTDEVIWDGGGWMVPSYQLLVFCNQWQHNGKVKVVWLFCYD